MGQWNFTRWKENHCVQLKQLAQGYETLYRWPVAEQRVYVPRTGICTQN